MKLLRTDEDVIEAWRERIGEIGVTHQTVDALAGWADGWCSKIMCGMKRPGPRTTSTMNAALGIAFVVTVDPAAAAKMEGRWVKRKRVQSKAASIAASMPNEVPAIIQITPELERKLVDLDHMKRIAKMGAKRRNKIMGKRARQRAASHAARMRWSKEKRA